MWTTDDNSNHKMKTIGIGDNVIDRHLDDKLMFAGGNSLNFAVYSKMMGYDSAYLGVVANDAYGEFILDTIKPMGVDLSRIVRKDGETGLCTIVLENGDRRISNDNLGGVVHYDPLVIDDSLLTYIRKFDVIQMGSLGYIDHEIPKLKQLNIPVVYDFADSWVEEDFQRMCPHIDVAFFSGHHLTESQVIGCLENVVANGANIGICTVGVRGAYVFDGNKIIGKQPYNIDLEVIDTTGAGDAFIAGFSTEYVAGQQLFNRIVKDDPLFYTNLDKRDYFEKLIERALSVGNLMAIKICMIVGAFGLGSKLLEEEA